ncbi:MAG TPA: dual specificity protein phosphatase family protein [Pyrinomonadaceae bacterium]|jgi:protein-tyrosine phosphatase|nr:dual specificity protein phosphatase family protein [Pyrinomonadaceae bacterium]
MRVTVHWIDGIESGRLGIMPRPRGGDWLEDEIHSLKMWGVGAVVSLLEQDEITELDIAEEKSLCEANGIAYLSFPIRDRSVPLSKQDALAFARKLVKLLQDGMSVVIHCRQGVGRSALVAACVLVLGGVSVDEVFEKIENARGCSVPDTEEQREWVRRFAESL